MSYIDDDIIIAHSTHERECLESMLKHIEEENLIRKEQEEDEQFEANI